MQGVLDCAAHADSGTHRLQKRGDRPGDIDCRKTRVADTVANKKAVYYSINSGQRECQNRWNYIRKKLFSPLHNFEKTSRFCIQKIVRIRTISV